MTLFQPDRYVQSIESISFDELEAMGIKGILVDLDNTIVGRNTNTVPPNHVAWAKEALARGFKGCVVSNNHGERVRTVAKQCGFPYVENAIKPFAYGYMAGAHKMGVRLRDCIVFGDQLFTDVLGAHLLRLPAVMVLPMHEMDLKHTLMLRKIEPTFMRHMEPETDPSN